MRLVVIFTRHELTEAQNQELRERFNGRCAYFIDRENASRNLTSADEAKEIVYGWILRALYDEDKCDRIQAFGVFPPILRNYLFNSEVDHSSVVNEGEIEIATWEAHNINRAPEGEKPQFAHSGWLQTGYYVLQAD